MALPVVVTDLHALALSCRLGVTDLLTGAHGNQRNLYAPLERILDAVPGTRLEGLDFWIRGAGETSQRQRGADLSRVRSLSAVTLRTQGLQDSTSSAF